MLIKVHPHPPPLFFYPITETKLDFRDDSITEAGKKLAMYLGTKFNLYIEVNVLISLEGEHYSNAMKLVLMEMSHTQVMVLCTGFN